jgi:hypothetical protein
MLLDGCYGA